MKEDDVAEETLTFVEKLKRWWDAALWVKRIFVTLKILFFGATAGVVVDAATGNSFVEDAAIEIGLIEKTPQPVIPKEVVAHSHELPEHHHNYPAPEKHDHPFAIIGHGHGIYALHGHTHDTTHTHPAATTLSPEVREAIASELERSLPPDHKKLH